MASVSTSRSRTRDIAPGEFRSVRPFLAATLRDLFQGEKARGPFSEVTQQFRGVEDPSRFAAPISNQERTLVQGIFEEGQGTPETQAASELRRSIIAGERLEPDPRTRAALQRPVLEAFEEARRGDVGAFTRAGQRIQESSPFFRARGIAERGLADSLADIEVNLREQERGRQFEAAGQAETIDAQRAATQVQRLQATALPRLVQDLGVQRGIEAFNQRIATLLGILGLSADVTSVAPGTSSSSFGLGIASAGG